MFHPLRLTSDEAWQFLKSVEDIEKCGIVCRVPNWWKRGASAVSLSVRLGGEKPSLLGFESIVSSQPSLSVDGVPLSREEIEELLQSTEGLAFLKGRWVEVNHDRLQRSFGTLASRRTRNDIPMLGAVGNAGCKGLRRCHLPLRRGGRHLAVLQGAASHRK